jgi:hypothetical protein
MNYNKIYNDFVSNRKTKYSNVSPKEKLPGYQWHHIIPKCLGGSNATSNLVFVSFREHLFAHKLLCKIHPQHIGLRYAANQMAGTFVRVDEDHVHVYWQLRSGRGYVRDYDKAVYFSDGVWVTPFGEYTHED